jgi:GNAT superfamily N-acetyltransferase
VSAIDLRLATSADRPFLEERLLDAVNWNASRRALTLEEALATPDIAHYITRWPGPRDAGVVASTDGIAVGAAWWTYFPLDDPGYGFVSPDVPEVTIGVAASHRGRGVGRALLRVLHEVAESMGIERLSLSVERANPATRLYRSMGYEDHRGDGDAVTMVAQLRSADHGHHR